MYFFLVMRNGGTSSLIARIILIMVAHSRFLFCLANASFSLLGKIIFDFCLTLIAFFDSSIL